LRYYPFNKAKLCVIPGGVDIEEFKPSDSREETSFIRKKLKLKEEIPLLLTVRRLEQRMGLENLIFAAGILCRRNPELKFQMVIIGKGRLEDRLAQLILKQEVSQCVQLVGLVSRETLPLYFRCADLFVLPTIAIEGFGLVTAEALSSGIPVMGTPVGATKEILKQVDEKLLFHKTSPEALAKGIETYLKSPKVFYSMKPKCRDLAVAQYSWETVVQKIEQEFIKIIA
jgi:glycosyltransferase involved in cell wall biosynthesis